MKTVADYLSEAELVAATRKQRGSTQAAALARMGIPFYFTGAHCRVERAVALAHELLPRVSGGGVDLSKVR